MSRDYTKYEILGMVKAFNKSRLAQAIVKDYIAKNTPNWEVLKTAFPDNIQGAKGVIAKKDAGVKERDFYMDAPFTLSDGTHEWIEPTGLAHYNTRERNITAEHDNIVDFDFYFKAADFDLSKLAFFGFANTDFHHSFPDYVGSYLAYDNKIIRPDQNIHRDKGFILHYEDNAKSYNYLIEG